MVLPRRCKLVTFDAFATLFSPRSPVENQYAEVAQSFGISVNPQSLKKSFKQAFRATDEELPVYGKGAGKGPEHWWSQVIFRSFTAAGVTSQELEPHLSKLTEALVTRFSSRAGYRLHDGVVSTLSTLRSRDISIGVVSNSDPRTERVLTDLGVDSVASVVTSWDVGIGKPDRRIWDAALAEARKSRGEEIRMDEVLHVGDDIDEDYMGARNAGMQAVLIREPSAIAPASRRADADRLDSVRVVTTLAQLLDLPELRPPDAV